MHPIYGTHLVSSTVHYYANVGVCHDFSDLKPQQAELVATLSTDLHQTPSASSPSTKLLVGITFDVCPGFAADVRA